MLSFSIVSAYRCMYWIGIFNLQWKMKTPDAVVVVSSCFPRATWGLGKWGQVLQTGIILFLLSVATWVSLLMKTLLPDVNYVKMKYKQTFINLETFFCLFVCFIYPIKSLSLLFLPLPIHQSMPMSEKLQVEAWVPVGPNRYTNWLQASACDVHSH